MSNIPISQIVQVNPRVIGAGGSQGALDGLLVSQNTALPVGQLRVFYNAADVAAFFGASSDEYAAASDYFGGIVGGGQQPASLTFGRFAAADTPAAVFGASLPLSLAQLQALAAGTLIVATSAMHVSGSINLSAATSFADAATIMMAGFTSPDFTITYDSARRRFVLSTIATGATAEVSAVTGTLAASVGLSAAAGAFQQPLGVVADTADTAMSRIVAISGNWGAFTHVWAADLDERKAFAAWNSAQQFQFIYVGWDSDAADLTADNAASFGALVRDTPYQGTVPVYGALEDGAAVLAWAASTNYLSIEGRNTLAFRQPVAGVTPKVTTLADANALLSNYYTYLGSYASASNTYTAFYNGALGGQFLWADTYLNQVWLRRTLQQALFETLLAYNTLPYNADGYNAIYQGAQGTITQALANGVIRAGVTLSNSQAAQINTQAGLQIATQVSSVGWYLQVTEPLSTTVRTERGSPVVNLWYCDGGSIQKIVVSSTTVL